MLPTLPDKYYLDHGLELFTHVASHCDHLLESEHQFFIQDFFLLQQDAQCLLIRFLSRKPRFLNRNSLDYPEIEDLDSAINELMTTGYISFVKTEDWSDFVQVLTKPQLLQCFKSTTLHLPAAPKKSDLVEKANEHFQGSEPALFTIQEDYLVRRNQNNIDYILFLFFGDLKSRLEKFVMRDLGVLRTRKGANNIEARFQNRLEALSTFSYQLLQRDLNNNTSDELPIVASTLLHDDAVGDAANKLRHQLLFQVGSLLAETHNELAIKLWQHSDVPAASAKWIRMTYKNGDRAQLKLQLEELQVQNLTSVNRIFIEDFYARKYLGKRTSVYTDMLRENSTLVNIDEAFINDVEEGVIQYYRRRGAECYFAENNFWRGLFALTFWNLLYGEDQKQYNEFDRIPQQLIEGTFYAENDDAIEKCLLVFDTPEQAKHLFLGLLGRHYGYPTGIFNWKTSFIDSLATFLKLGDPLSIRNSLRGMAKDYINHKDGYPDLMVAENGKLRFEEVKAPGDSLRENQLVCINRLRVCGFEIDLVQVDWSVDPNQTYAVVDIETTGGKRGLHAITEIAIVKIRDGRIIDSWSTLINPQSRIPSHITRLTGIDNRMVASAPVFAEISEQLMEQLNNTIFVAHNVGFDYSFIAAAFEQLGQTFRLPKYCTVKNTRKTFPGLKSYALGNLVKHFDIDMKRAHRALDDARATAELLMMIQAKNSAKNPKA